MTHTQEMRDISMAAAQASPIAPPVVSAAVAIENEAQASFLALVIEWIHN